ncbi:MAG: penicillin-binding protein 2 [Burkholderiales bacterium]|nr:penicillin-binding protein 2 [Burkholderiales bacterium]
MITNHDEIHQLYWRMKNNNPSADTKSKNISNIFVKSRDRATIINWIMLSSIALIALRLIFLNTIKSSYLEKQLNTRIMRTINLPAMRGEITDRDGIPLAVSTPVEAIWADPSDLIGLTQTQQMQLASILGVSVSELASKISDREKTFVYLQRAMSPDKAKQVMQLGIDGIYSMQEYKRFYPSGAVTASIVGFNNIDDNGADGMEYAKNKALQGINGNKQIIRDLKGRVVDNLGIQNAQNGQTLHLSINNRIQYIAYNALKNQMDKSLAKGGSAIVLDAKTGEVLAMVNLPTYNPNNRENVTPEMMKNRAATNVFDPGSIMKPLVIAKAIDNKMITPSTMFNTTPYTVGGKTIKDTHPETSMNVSDIIRYSSNIGTAKVAMMFSSESLWNFYREVGFGQKMGTGFPGETKGILLPWKKWYPVDHALMAFGYGISVSLFQMAHAYTTFTNNGCLLPVSFEKINGDPNNISCTQVFSPQTASTMRTMLASTAEDGTGKNARVEDYTVAGKTGTSQVLDGGRYRSDRHIGSFVGFAPAIDPKIIVAVMVDQPTQGSYYGAQTAAPVFAQIVQPSLHVLKVKPDKITTK